MHESKKNWTLCCMGFEGIDGAACESIHQHRIERKLYIVYGWFGKVGFVVWSGLLLGSLEASYVLFQGKDLIP